MRKKKKIDEYKKNSRRASAGGCLSCAISRDLVFMSCNSCRIQGCLSELSFCENYIDHKPEHMLIIKGNTILFPKQV